MLLDFVTTHGSISMIDKNIGQLEDRIDTINCYLVKKKPVIGSSLQLWKRPLTK